jgi:hypothetical protein
MPLKCITVSQLVKMVQLVFGLASASMGKLAKAWRFKRKAHKAFHGSGQNP